MAVMNLAFLRAKLRQLHSAGMTYASKHVRSDGPGVKPGVKRTHLIDLLVSAAACKAVYAGSIPTPAAKTQQLNS
jgi:hypothetical protein